MTAPLTRPLADTLFLQNFAAFCRAQGDATYEWDRPSVCALAQFGYPGALFPVLDGIPLDAYQAALLAGERDGPARFSDLADRLDAILVDAPGIVR